MVSKELNVHGIRGATRNDQRVVAELLEKGRIRMPVHAILPLHAGKRLGSRRTHRPASLGRIETTHSPSCGLVPRIHVFAATNEVGLDEFHLTEVLYLMKHAANGRDGLQVPHVIASET